MKAKKNILFALSVIALIVLGLWFKSCIAIDSCLDSGGRWNYELKNCEH